jgi:triacylglycerol esterase/lipase EstA (alpha/beta hydrolase family)
MKQIIAVLALVWTFMASIAYADKPDGSVYLDGGDVKYGLILAHGQGKSPTWLVVDPVRKGIHDQLGYHTLSLQMPVAGGNWKNYAGVFPEAYRTIDQGISFLKEKGVTRIYLLGHSMGARMASAFVATHPNSGLSGLIVVGCRNNGGAPLDCDESLQKVDLPVLDIWGGSNGKDSEASSQRAGLRSATYTQVAIDGANHKFEQHEQELVAVVANWLKKQN